LPQTRRLAPFAAQLELARVHPQLIALTASADGYVIAESAGQGAFELASGRGLAGYGLARALRLLLDALAGVSALHATHTARGGAFVHGELVPELLRVDAQGVARLIPLATWHWSSAGTLPAPQRWGHLAPERLLGDALDPRADVFSAGVLLWEALAGRRLFESESIDSITARLLDGKVNLPQLPPELAWALPLKALSMRALSVSPANRFATCAEFARAIETVAAGHVATHSEVLSYFNTRHHSLRPSQNPPPAAASSHKSSLSALVSPIQSATAARAAPPPSARPNARPALEIRTTRAGWRAIAGTCLLAAFAIGAAVRYQASGSSKTGAASAWLPQPSEPLPTATASAKVPGHLLARPAPEVDLRPAASAAPDAASGHGTPLLRSSAPHPRLGAKPGRKRSKEAELYGI
jgi:serine/threonine-protein kinase